MVNPVPQNPSPIPPARVEAERRSRRRLLGGGIAVVVVLVAAGIVTGVVLNDHPSASAPAAARTDADSNTIAEVPASPARVATGASTDAPWPAPANASGRTAVAGLPMLSEEGTVEHIHAHLTITVDGRAVPLPADVGIDLTEQKISPLHTHDATGIIHIESAVKGTFTLGQFFTEWNVALDANRLGAYTTADGHTLTVFVNGSPVTGNPAAIELTAHEDITIVYAPAGQTAAAPAAFVWPEGY
ncbi:MAG TPA: hypothetical protein VGC18_11740 [Lacisediminihabitans sp.]